MSDIANGSRNHCNAVPQTSRGSVASFSINSSTSLVPSGSLNPSNFKCLRQADVRETGFASRAHSTNRVNDGSNAVQGAVELFTFVTPEGSLQLGYVLEMIRKLLTVHEVKFAMQLLEDFTTHTPATYTLNATVGDFAQDLQRFFAESVIDGSANPRTGPISLIQSAVWPSTGQQSASGIGTTPRIDDSNYRGASTRRDETAPPHSEKNQSMKYDCVGSPDGAQAEVSHEDPATNASQISNACTVALKPGLPGFSGDAADSPISKQSPFKTADCDLPDIAHVDSNSMKMCPSLTSLGEHTRSASFQSYFAKNWRLQRRMASNIPIHFDIIVDSEIDLDDVSLEQTAFLAKSSDQFILHPNHKARTFLDLVVLGLIIMECVALPLSLSFDIRLPPSVNALSLALFGADMVMSFTTGYFHRDLLIMRRRRIVKNYLQTWFVLDIVSLIPWEDFFQVFRDSARGGDGDGGGGTRTTFVRILKLGKLLRVLRLLRMAKITALIKRLQSVGLLPADLSHLKFGMAVAKMFVIFGLLSHWAACIWGWLGTPENIGHGPADLLPHDITTCTMGGPCEAGIEGSPWRHRYGFDNYESLINYFVALQFTAGLITGGDTPMQASQPIERVFTILVMFCSVFVISVVVGEILLIMNRRAEARLAFDELNSQAREFMAARKVPTHVQQRVFRYMDTQNMVSCHNSPSNRQFMSSLSQQLQQELVEHLNSTLLLQHPFFANIQHDWPALQRLCIEAGPVIFAASETVMEKGAPATCAHFIVTGKVRVESPVITCQKVLYLRPPSWIGDICLFVETLRTATVAAVITTETLMLTKASLLMVCDSFPSVREEFDIFRSHIENDNMELLSCPICHDIGHCARTCPVKKQAKQIDHGSGSTASLGRLKANLRRSLPALNSNRGSIDSNEFDSPAMPRGSRVYAES